MTDPHPHLPPMIPALSDRMRQARADYRKVLIEEGLVQRPFEFDAVTMRADELQEGDIFKHFGQVNHHMWLVTKDPYPSRRALHLDIDTQRLVEGRKVPDNGIPRIKTQTLAPDRKIEVMRGVSEEDMAPITKP